MMGFTSVWGEEGWLLKALKRKKNTCLRGKAWVTFSSCSVLVSDKNTKQKESAGLEGQAGGKLEGGFLCGIKSGRRADLRSFLLSHKQDEK